MDLDVTNTDAMKVHSVCQINHRGKPQAACSHLAWKLPASWHLVSLKTRGINPCGVVRNYFDLECKIEFVAYSVHTLALVFVNSFMCTLYMPVVSLLNCCHLVVVSKSPSLYPPSHPIPSPPPPLFFLLSILFPLLFPIIKPCAACTLFHSLPIGPQEQVDWR